METDSFFCQLFKHLPGTLFELLGMPGEMANAYRFDSVELKKAFRIDGLFLPAETGLPLYFVEVQFQLVPNFYANLFAKVFCYLEENNPAQEWNAVAIFASRDVEPKQLGPYEDLLNSPRVKRIYLNERKELPTPSFGLDLLKLLFVDKDQERPLVGKLVHRAETEILERNFRR